MTAWTADSSRCDGAPFAVAPAAPASSASPQRSAGAPTSHSPREWLAWMADQPNLHDAITEAFAAGVGSGIIAYAVGQWERENRIEVVARRSQAIFARWGH